MTNGLKSGSADDPWEDEGTEEGASTSSTSGRDRPERGSRTDRASSTVPDAETESDTGASDTEASTSRASRSYLDRRDGAKDERELVQFFLRDEVYGDMVEGRVRQEVAEELGEQPGKFDLREALVAVGQEHVDEAVDELRDMGY